MSITAGSAVTISRNWYHCMPQYPPTVPPAHLTILRKKFPSSVESVVDPRGEDRAVAAVDSRERRRVKSRSAGKKLT